MNKLRDELLNSLGITLFFMFITYPIVWGSDYENKFMVSWSISVVLSFFTGLIREIINELKKNNK